MPQSPEILSPLPGPSKFEAFSRLCDDFSAQPFLVPDQDRPKYDSERNEHMTNENDTPPDANEPSTDFKIDIDPKIGESLQGGMDAIGKVFGGLVGAIKDAVGPELMRSMEVAGWLGQLASCLDDMANGLKTNSEVPAEASGQFAFYVEQFDSSLDGSKLESQKASLKQQLEKAEQAVASAVTDPDASAAALAQASGYFKAAAASLVPIQGKDEQST